MPTHSTLSRRQFLRITAVAGLGLGVAGHLLANASAGATALDHGLQTVHDTRIVMGCIANITLLSAAKDAAHARQALDATFARMQVLEGIFSRHQPESALCRLNQAGRLAEAPTAFQEVLRDAIQFSELTNGAFDVTVEPLLSLYREISRTGEQPSAQSVTTAHERVNYRWIGFDDSTVYFQKPGMALTLDGIAKGYIIDQGTETLRSHGYQDVLVEVGGDMQAAGAHPWKVGIQSPTNPAEQFVRVKSLSSGGLTTSGDYFNYFTADRRLHHILDPRTGISPTELSSVSVTAPTALDADALSTGLMVMGTEAGLALIKTLPGIEALFITKDQQVVSTPGFDGNA